MNELDYAKSYFNKKNLNLKILAGDAGSRQYFRIFSDNESYILMNYSNDIESVNDFLEVQTLLEKNKINCPKLISQDKDLHYLLLEDLTDYTLEQAFRDNNYIKYYESALKQLAKFHSKAVPTKSIKDRFFDYEKLFWEVEFAIKHLNELFDVDVSDTLVKDELSSLCTQLSNLSTVICHRDFHSRNLMIKNETVYFIDFQDARMGPWQYDVASLLYDSYVNLSEAEITHLLDFYHKSITFKLEPEWKSNLDLQIIQRTFKACGSFASLKNIKNKDRYLQYLPKCFNLLLSKTKKYPNFTNYIKNITDSDKGIIS